MIDNDKESCSSSKKNASTPLDAEKIACDTKLQKNSLESLESSSTMDNNEANKQHAINENIPFYKKHIYSTIVFFFIFSYLIFLYSKPLASYIVVDLLNITEKSFSGNALIFFLANIPSILALTIILMLPISFLRSYVNPATARKLLTTKYIIFGNILAAILGAIAPFCSCSAIPLFIVFITSGIPLGVTLSFLLAAPLIHEVAVIFSLSLLGYQITAIYVGLGLFISITVGYIMGKLNLDKYIESWVHESIANQDKDWDKNLTFRHRLTVALEDTIELIRTIYIYLIIGIGIGAIIRFSFSSGSLAPYLGSDVWYAVPLAVLAGIPLYASAATMVPIIQTLLEQGVGIGTALVFMMSTTALSLPSAILLRKVLKMRLLVIFFLIVSISFIFIGYILNWSMQYTVTSNLLL